MSSVHGTVIREMTIEDVPAGLSLCRASRWNQTARDWTFFLTAPSHAALVAVADDVVVGTVATLPYGPFTWISMVLVAPLARGRGVGTLLLERGLELVPEASTARLDATPAGEAIYRKLGFVDEYGLARWFRDAQPVAPGAERRAASMDSRAPGVERRAASMDRAPSAERRAPTVRSLIPADLPAVYEMDVRAFGASRRALLESLAVDAPEYAWVAETDGRLNGYLFGRHGHVREQLGPLVADRAETASLLLHSCLALHSTRSFFIDAPDDQRVLRDHLDELGFRIERTFLRMYRGRLTTPGDPAAIYAITGPEFG